MNDTTDLIRQKLAALDPAKIEIVDDSARHAGHAGARGGGGFSMLAPMTSSPMRNLVRMDLLQLSLGGVSILLA